MSANPTAFVTDTHALYWYLIADKRLSKRAKAAFDEAAQGRAYVYLPAIVISEFYYLNIKLGSRLDFAEAMREFQTSAQFRFVAFEAIDALDFDRDAQVPEMHDRIIVGVARRLNAALLTHDTQIVASGLVQTIW
jgi:PIN domain nuclease of toxin-antitoxin system